MSARDEVRISTEIGAVWEFVVPSSASTIAEQSREQVALVEQLFGVFGEFLTPTRLTYHIEIYPDDLSLESVDGETEPVETVERELVGETDISFADFAKSAAIDRPGTRLIRRVPFEHNRLKVRLESGDTYVGRDDCVLYHKGEPRQVDSNPDPLSVTVSLSPNRGNEPVDSEFLYRILISIRSDIWVQQTDTGQTNREYLGEFLAELDDAVAPVGLNREAFDQSDFWYDLSLYTVENGNVPFDPADVY